MVHSKEKDTEETMSVEEEMTIDERYKYLRKMQKRYRKANRKEKSRLLDEMEAVAGLGRKRLIRLMNGEIRRKPRKRQRGRKYGQEVSYALGVIAESMDWICAERLKPNLVWTARHLAEHDELVLTPQLLEKLEAISVSSVGRILSRQARDQPRLPRKRPQPANRVAQEIPTRRIPWQETQPGHFEVDTVHHGGPSASGHYVHTVQMIDVATGWSERIATLGRSYLVMQDAFKRIENRLPFDVVEIHPDNGSEFLNNHLVRFWKELFKDVDLSRSRAWQKNDNRFVEQKNASLVRAYLGDIRLDTVEQTILLNQLYDKMWLYYNFFQPVMRLKEKILLPGDGGRPRIKRKFDTARTPFDRLCATKALSPDLQVRFQAMRAEINPRHLRLEIYSLLDQLFALPAAVPDSTQDVYLTLFAPVNSIRGEDSPVLLSFE